MTTPTNREAVNWEKQFVEQFCDNTDNQRTGYYILDEVRGVDLLQFIRQTHLDLLREVEREVIGQTWGEMGEVSRDADVADSIKITQRERLEKMKEKYAAQ